MKALPIALLSLLTGSLASTSAFGIPSITKSIAQDDLPLYSTPPSPQLTFQVLPPTDLQNHTNTGFPGSIDLLSASIPDLAALLRNGSITSVDLTRHYLSRIHATSFLNAYLFLNAYALIEAAEADEKLAALRSRDRSDEREEEDLLLGIPYALKGNIAAPAHVAPTTAGSFSMLGTVVKESAKVEQRLRERGAVLLGLTNLDEFAHAKGIVPWGWSSLGGRIRSPFHAQGEVSGSSGGSAISTSLGLAAFTLGTQTGHSIVSPASFAGVVGFKPSPGSVPRDGVIPISLHVDAVGPIANDVQSARIVYETISGRKRTRECKRSWRVGLAENEAFEPQGNYSGKSSIRARRRQIVELLNALPNVEVVPLNFSEPLIEELRNRGAEASETVVLHDQAVGMQKYLHRLKHSSGLRSIKDIVSWHRRYASIALPAGPFPPEGRKMKDAEYSYADQSFLEECASIQRVGYGNATYRRALKESRSLGVKRMLEPYLRENEFDVLLTLTQGSIAGLAAIASAPIATVPIGFNDEARIEEDAGWPFDPYPGMPFGMAVTALNGQEEKVLCFAELLGSVVKDDVGGHEMRKRLREDVKKALKLES